MCDFSRCRVQNPYDDVITVGFQLETKRNTGNDMYDFSQKLTDSTLEEVGKRGLFPIDDVESTIEGKYLRNNVLLGDDEGAIWELSVAVNNEFGDASIDGWTVDIRLGYY